MSKNGIFNVKDKNAQSVIAPVGRDRESGPREEPMQSNDAM